MRGRNWQGGTESKPQSYQYKNLEGGGLDVAYEGTYNSMMNTVKGEHCLGWRS